MTRDDQAAFIKSLCDSVRDHALGKLSAMPEGWDGMELREYLADQFDRERHMSRRKADYRRRLRDYRSDVATRPL